MRDEAAGRAQGKQAVWRGAGTALALLGGGLLLAIGNGAPFIAAAVISTVILTLFLYWMIRQGVPTDEQGADDGVRQAMKSVADLVRHSRPLQAFLVANASWEPSLGALKTFVVLYVTVELGYSRAAAALLIGGVACIILVAAVVSGRLADRHGSIRRDARRAARLRPRDDPAVPLLRPLGGRRLRAVRGDRRRRDHGASLRRADAADARSEHGSLTGYYSFSRGLGTWLGPLLAGLAITVVGGYQAMWIVCAAAIVLSIPFLPALKLD